MARIFADQKLSDPRQSALIRVIRVPFFPIRVPFLFPPLYFLTHRVILFVKILTNPVRQ
ncbi:protein of unknown function [Candidatus Promineifilum breve]|uniref:Uncharacterized protein n=1 Tax=Candidatus Promineifilum breve TaxID=1806508 RepID=A0A170PJX0_9CHLR|nr:protein of unknown function [Candidatus Promineifilum breve]